MEVVAGIDVGKVSLDVSVSEGPVLRFDNTAKSITRLLKHLKEQCTTMTVCESTGGYERLLVSRLRKAEIAVRVAHPSRVRSFARACGYEAKTDPRDAQVLSRFGQVFPDSDTPELGPEREELQDLLRRRRQFVEQRVQELNRLDKGVSAAVANSTKATSPGWIRRLRSWRRSTRKHCRVALPWPSAPRCTAPCLVWGPLTAAILVAHLPELGHWDSKALTSLVGLAPWSRDSGQKRGQRAIRDGRGIVRKALYLCACSVIQVSGELRRFYQNLRQRGKPGNLALVAVMRKLLLQLNALARRQTPWVVRPA